MNKFTVFLVSLMLVVFSSLAFAGDLNITFEDDSDIANWSHYDEGNVYTTETWNSTGGVNGSGALELGDGGYAFLDKRPVSAVVGQTFSMTLQIKTENWDDQATYPIFVTVNGIDDMPDTVYVNGSTTFTTVTITGTAVATDGYIRIEGSNTLLANKVWVDNVMFDDGQNIFFSEYIEGGSNNKALEIYNPTDAAIALDNYIIRTNYNGNAWSGVYNFPVGASLKPGDVFVAAHAEADAAILAVTDSAYAYGAGAYITSFNGDDVRALCYVNGTDTTIIDIIGLYNLEDPGSGWAVAGVADATKDHTLVRKESVQSGQTDWAISAGTNTDDSEWIVYDKDTFDYLGAHPGTPQGPVKVTFRANVSRIFGLDSTGTVDLRGSLQGWTPNANPMINDGGDYWSIEWTFAPEDVGTTVYYKYGGNIVNLDGTEINAWENDLPGAEYLDNRTLVVPTEDTVLPLDYVGHADGPPYVPSDSIDVFFRVNMASNDLFNPATDKVYIVGAFPNQDGSDNMWVPDKYALTREGDSDYWHYHLKLASAMPGTMYRYTTGSWDNSENVRGHGMFPDNENRGVAVNQDTTIAWKWWNDVPPVVAAGEDTIDVMFTADLNRAITENGFTVGDTMVVEWGYNGSSILAADTLVQQIAPANYYAKKVSVERVQLGTTLEYKYFKIKRGERFEEIYYDFDSKQNNRILTLPATVGEGEVVQAMDNVESNTDPHRQLRYRNTDLISQDVLVTFEVDLRPAYYQLLLNPGTIIDDIQGDLDVTEADSVQVWGVAMNGPATQYGWGNPTGNGDWGAHLMTLDYKRMWDDGTNGDLTAGDTIWTRQRQFYSDPDSNDVIGQEFKFGIRGGDNEGGDGGYGLNHIENIEDSNPTMTIHSQFGSINPIFYSSWDFDLGTIDDINDDVAVIRSSRLVGNYPNPFNPATTIRFELENAQDVSLTVYDVVGRKVISLLQGTQRAGVHKVLWNGIDSKGNAVSTGVYFYHLSTKNYNKTMKMILMK